MIRFDEKAPIYLQLRDEIERAIIAGSLRESEMIPSIRALAQEYSLNPQTVANALGELTERGIIAKQRGIGFFVQPDARKALLTRWRDEFLCRELVATLEKGKSLGVTGAEMIQAVQAAYSQSGDHHESV
jgi:GntR family transcriptional regulator